MSGSADGGSGGSSSDAAAGHADAPPVPASTVDASNDDSRLEGVLVEIPDNTAAEQGLDGRNDDAYADVIQEIPEAPPPASDALLGAREEPVVERVATGDRRLEAAWEGSTPIDGGRVYVAQDDQAYDSALNIAPTSGEYTVVVHGNEYGTGIDTAEGPVDLSGDDLGALIESDPNWKGQDIRLFSCETGKLPADGGDPVAQQVADRLDRNVTAPTELAWGPGPDDPSNQGYSSSAVWEIDPLTGEEFARPATGPDNPDGQFITYAPRKEADR